MKKIFLLCFLFFSKLVSFAQNSQSAGQDEFKKITSKTLWFIDSLQTDRSDAMKLNPNVMGTVSVIRNKGDGMDSIVYIETSSFCRKRYWRFLSSKSPQYLKAVPNPESDTTVQYILNGNALSTLNNAALTRVNDDNLSDIQVVDLNTLPNRDNDLHKKYGVIVNYFDKKKNGSKQ